MTKNQERAQFIVDIFILLVLAALFTYGVYEVYYLVSSGAIPIDLDLFERVTN